MILNIKKKDTELWIENLWENTVKNEYYIKKIIYKPELFTEQFLT